MSSVSLIHDFPRTFWVANVMELFERAAYYGLNSVLAVYLTLSVAEGGVGASEQAVGFLQGIVYAATYVLPILGGALAACLATSAWGFSFVTEENPPLNFTRDGQVAGVSTAVVREMATRANLTSDFTVMPWPQAYARAQESPEACVYSTVRSPERASLFQWIGPITRGEWSLFGRQGYYGLYRGRVVQGRYVTDLAAFGNGQLVTQSLGHVVQASNGGVAACKLLARLEPKLV